ncbi:Nitroreductase domain-containing protein [Candidatus Ornithobacterium hominis]|uniref:SagB/ThcOx family dehydrogenase n=1 Tax=Candidatus Ornithobacterium hominis TaxID=2497989 RepID=UPI0024BCBA31|nr:SagB/ThcOx family dehydrogenase [Candidatus Ornithobacterium hominis]CAI9429637.1 Nitroreductase domain-containing protein [Candidatus Ornithobacterium hominis]
MNISHNFFIYFKNNEPLIYNFKTKEEYSVRKEYLKTLVDYSKSSIENTDFERIVEDFIKTDILTLKNNKETPYLNYYAHIFHNITKDTSVSMSESTEEEWASTYLEICERVQKKEFPERGSIEDFDTVHKLPNPNKIEVELYDTLKKRKTIREFEKNKTELNKLSNLLYYTFGYIHGEEEDYLPFKRRSSPSGGCLQIIEPYIAIFNVEGIENGIYWYEPNTHSICKVSNHFNYQNLRECLAGQFFGNDCSFGIFYVANLEVLAWKYKTSRNYKVVFLEAGHFSQTSQLVATSISLDTWVTGAFKDSDIEKHCKLDGISKIPVFFTAYGKGKFSHMHTAMKKKLEEKKQKKNIL